MGKKAAFLPILSILGTTFAVRRRARVLWIIALVAGFSVLPAAHAQERTEHSADQGKAIDDGAPKVGDLAPDFTLKSIDGKSEVTLSSFRGKRPVVLIFGSWT